MASIAGIVCGEPVEAVEIQAIKFSSIEKHDDAWAKMDHQGKQCAPAFMHLVVSGKCIIHDNKGAQTFMAGDVFTMNPNATHWTTNKRDCITLVATIPRNLIK